MSCNNTTQCPVVSEVKTGNDAIIQISEETYEQFAFVCNTVISPIVCFLGLIGGCLGMGVLYRDARRQKLSIYIFLCALTFSDTVYLLLGLVRTIPNIMSNYDEELGSYVEEHMKLGTIYLDMVFSHSSVGVIVVMSLERCFALLRPFTVKNSWLAKYPKRIVALVFVFNIVFLLPYAVYFEVQSYEANNLTEYYIQFREEVVADLDKYMLVQTIVDYFLPAAALVVINATIIISFSRIRRTRERTFNMMASSINNQQAKITITVVIITVLYFLLSIPNLTIKVLAFIDKEYSFDGEHKVAFWLFIDISNLFAYMNAANDCIVYILVSSHYRQIFKQMYCRCSKGRETASNSIGESLGSEHTGDSSLPDSTRY